jgi:glycosyltransferase involved in cell wall biosynthesis
MIAFIVPAHNEAPLLPKTLLALRDAARATGEPHEILVVDDASTDATAEVALGFGARVVSVAHRQISATRNAGARASQAEILFFVDADTLVNAAVVIAALRALREGAVAGGAPFFFDGRLPLWARMVEPLAHRYQRHARLAAGCFFFCRRDAFERVGGFDTGLFAAEEIALSESLKQHGPLVILNQGVLTSGRKLRAHSGREHLRILTSYFLRGPEFLRSRHGLGLWYGERRADPERAAS